MKPSKKTLSIARLVHVYVSMALLTLLLFFSVTGITLNHPEWFRDHQAVIEEKETAIDIQPALAQFIEQNEQNIDNLSASQITQLAMQIEKALAISLSSAEHELMSGELFFSIKSAGKNTNIALDLTTGELFYEATNYGLWAQLNDLHKGRNTSNFWSWIIDLSSVLFILFAITGFILAMPQKRFRKTLLSSVVSTLLAIVIIIYAA